MITDEQIADGCNKAYLKAGHNAYFGNGFEAGVRFALEQVKNLSSKPMLCDSLPPETETIDNPFVWDKNQDGNLPPSI